MAELVDLLMGVTVWRDSKSVRCRGCWGEEGGSRWDEERSIRQDSEEKRKHHQGVQLVQRGGEAHCRMGGEKDRQGVGG